MKIKKLETSEDFIWIQSWSLHQEPSLGKSYDAFIQNIKTVTRPGGRRKPRNQQSQFVPPVLRVSPVLHLLLSDVRNRGHWILVRTRRRLDPGISLETKKSQATLHPKS